MLKSLSSIYIYSDQHVKWGKQEDVDGQAISNLDKLHNNKNTIEIYHKATNFYPGKS